MSNNENDVFISDFNVALKNIFKLKNFVDWQLWKRNMFDALKIFDLLIFIIEYKKLSNDVSIKKTQMFKRGHKKAVTIMKMRCRKHVRKLIKDCINAIEAYKILKKNFIFKNVDIINDAFHKLFNTRLKDYFSIDAYINKFRNINNELKILSFKMILNDNLLIYWFHINLKFNYN